MELRKPALLGAWVLVVLNLVIAFGAIALLVRMGPAIEDIIAHHHDSLSASEEMLASLALGLDGEREGGYLAGLERAAASASDPEEREMVQRLRSLSPQVLDGAPAAREESVAAICRLSAINRAAMERADSLAHRLGLAGAWGVVFLALISFVGGLLFVRRLNAQVLLPLEELVEVIRADKAGDHYRRCPMATVHGDFRIVYAELNSLLDERLWHGRIIDDRLQKGGVGPS